MMRRAIVAAVALSTTAWCGEAAACGVWAARDTEMGWFVVFHYHAIAITRRLRPEGRILEVWSGQPGRSLEPGTSLRLMDCWGETRLECRRGKKRLFAFKGNTLLLEGRQAAALGEGSIEVGPTRFKLTLGRPRPRAATDEIGGGPPGAKGVEVSRDGRTILEGNGFDFCEPRRGVDIRQRVALYLAWRALLRPTEVGIVGK